jgi:dethiobiotin synthetase
MTAIKTTFPSRLFITGTDTGIGKTVISAMIVKGLGASYWKPVQSGLEGVTDTDRVLEMTGLPKKHFYPETYRLGLPLSPHASAAREGIRIDLNAFQVPEDPDPGHLIIEGAGGVLVPLNERHFMLDLMIRLESPILLVASSSLGTINHTLLSLKQLRRSGLNVFGVVMNGPMNPGNREAIEYYGNVTVLAEVEPLPAMDPENLKGSFIKYFSSCLAFDHLTLDPLRP